MSQWAGRLHPGRPRTGNRCYARQTEAAGLESEDLDEVVHELVASIAANMNNSGMEGQLGYLIEEMGIQAATKQLDRLVEERARTNTKAIGDHQVADHMAAKIHIGGKVRRGVMLALSSPSMRPGHR